MDTTTFWTLIIVSICTGLGIPAFKIAMQEFITPVRITINKKRRGGNFVQTRLSKFRTRKDGVHEVKIPGANKINEWYHTDKLEWETTKTLLGRAVPITKVYIDYAGNVDPIKFHEGGRIENVLQQDMNANLAIQLQKNKILATKQTREQVIMKFVPVMLILIFGIAMYLAALGASEMYKTGTEYSLQAAEIMESIAELLRDIQQSSREFTKPPA